MYLNFDLRTFGPYGILGIIILLTVPICGAFRLARYNTSSFDGVFTGVPITIIGCFLALLPIIYTWITIPVFVIVIFMILGSYLMVSTLHLKKI